MMISQENQKMGNGSRRRMCVCGVMFHEKKVGVGVVSFNFFQLTKKKTCFIDF